MKAAILIFFGGGIGSAMRYGLSRWINNSIITDFPLGTFIVNVVGCFLIGFIIVYTRHDKENEQQWRLFLATGLCGGFTTFSAFSIENIELFSEGRVFIALLYTMGSVLLGFLATYCGLLAGRAL